MATIRRRGAKWQVQIRRVGVRAISRSFHTHKDAEAWARQMEVQADRRDLPLDPRALQRVTLGQLVERYRDTVSVRKRGYDIERVVLNAFLRHRICRKPLSEIKASDFASSSRLTPRNASNSRYWADRSTPSREHFPLGESSNHGIRSHLPCTFLLMALVWALAFPTPVTATEERWVCRFPHKIEPTIVVTRFMVLGDLLKTPGLDYKILENNEFSIVAVWSMSKIWSGNTQPRMGAAVVVIDKLTGKYRRSSVYVGEVGDDSVYGECERE